MSEAVTQTSESETAALPETSSAPETPAPALGQEKFQRALFDVPGGQIAGIHFGAPKPTPDIVFLHATGFNARTYASMLDPLVDRLHVLAIDARGHGRTELPTGRFGYTSWRRHRDDLIALMQRHFTKPVTLAGHSMGATVSLLAAGKRPDLVNGVALIDPVIMSPAAYTFMELPGAPLLLRLRFPIAAKAAKRRARFESREQALALLSGRGVFKSFSPEALADYVADGFVESAKGGVELACRRGYEAATFAAHRHDPWAALKRAPAPIVVLRADKHSTLPPSSAERLLQMRPDARLATVEGASHMLPMERPDRVRAAIEMAYLMARQARHVHEVD